MLLFNGLLFMPLSAQMEFYPPGYGNISGTNTFQCPSNMGIRCKTEARLMNQNYAGGWEKIMNSLAMISYSLDDRSNMNHSTIGIMAASYKEGKYLQKNAIYAAYAWKSQIHRSLFFSGGIRIGGMNYLVHGTPSTGEGSDMAPDASAGVSIYNASFVTSVSINSVFRSELQPIYETTVMNRFVTVYHEQIIKLNDWLTSNASVMIQYPDYRKYSCQFSYEIIVKRKLILGTGYKSFNGIHFAAGLANFCYGKGCYSINLLYNRPLTRKDYSINRIEVMIVYRSKR